jgi:hypothetical protein
MTIDIEALKYDLEKACEYAKKEFDLSIMPNDYGVVTRNGVPTPEYPGGCCCPIGALELLTKTARSQFAFNYESFVEGFDSELDEAGVERHMANWDAPHAAIFRLGVEFRKKYVKEAA